LAASEHIRESNRLALARCLPNVSFKTYDSAWRSWQRCPDFYGFNIDCLDDKGKPCTFQVCANLVYLYIGFELGLRQIKPLSIANIYLPGIAKHFAIHHIENFFYAAAYHEWTKTLLAGYIRIWKETFPEGQQAKIPFTMVLALQAERFLTSRHIKFSDFPFSGDPRRVCIETMRMTCALLIRNILSPLEG
jgi:hypothetical protein